MKRKKTDDGARNTAYAIGKFDALHLGHRALVEHAALMAPPALLTFTGMAEILGWPARAPLVAASDRLRILRDWQERIGRSIGIAEIPFAGIHKLKPEEFVTLMRERMDAAALVVGDDFRFGHGRAADAADLARIGKKIGVEVKIVAPVRLDGDVISSSRVRAALEQGRMHDVTGCLGRPHRIVATVVHGQGRGKSIGVPTANCGNLENQPPAAAVYAGRGWIDGQGPWPAAINAGVRPTVDNSRAFALEAHLIGFAGDCYGKRIELELFTRLRGERKFPDIEALREQIQTDIQLTQDLAQTYQPPE